MCFLVKYIIGSYWKTHIDMEIANKPSVIVLEYYLLAAVYWPCKCSIIISLLVGGCNKWLNETKAVFFKFILNLIIKFKSFGDLWKANILELKRRAIEEIPRNISLFSSYQDGTVYGKSKIEISRTLLFKDKSCITSNMTKIYPWWSTPNWDSFKSQYIPFDRRRRHHHHHHHHHHHRLGHC